MDFEHISEIGDGATAPPMGGNFTGLPDYVTTHAAAEYLAAEEATMAVVQGPDGRPVWVNKYTGQPASPAQHAVSSVVHDYWRIQRVGTWIAAIGIVLALLTVFVPGLLPLLAQAITWPIRHL
jgi:hypothetical protein